MARMPPARRPCRACIAPPTARTRSSQRSTIGSGVKAITDRSTSIVTAKDSNVYGYTNVYLEGDSVFGRTQEVNLGNITADANASKARAALGLPDSGGGLLAEERRRSACFGRLGAGEWHEGWPAGQPDHQQACQRDLAARHRECAALRQQADGVRHDPDGLLAILNCSPRPERWSDRAERWLPTGGQHPLLHRLGAREPDRRCAPCRWSMKQAPWLPASLENGVVLPTAPASIQCISLNFTGERW